MNSSTKRRNKTNSNRVTRSKTSMDKNVYDGVYCNARFMHSATSLIGCLIEIATADGATYEGIFKAFSQQCEFAIELAHIRNRSHSNLPTKEDVADVLFVKLNDVVSVSAPNTDLDYATKDQFSTDTAISKYNGQIVERELEPWDETAGDVEDVATLDIDNENGWDVNDMFRTNEQQYGVQSTYDNTLSGYTTQLEPKNTDEYKKQEAKASKIASEIESSPNYLARMAVENGDEEDKYSAVIRPDSIGNSSVHHKYIPPSKRKNAQPGKPRMSPSQNALNNMPTSIKSHPPPQGHGPQHQSHGPRMQPHGQPHGQPPGAHPPQSHYGPPQQPSMMGGVATIPHHPPPQQSHQATLPQQQLPAINKMPPQNENNDVKMNGEKIDKDEKKGGLRNDNPVVDFRESDQVKKAPAVPEQLQPIHISNKNDRKNLNPKPHDEQIAEFKKFSSDFKLEENEENECNKPDVMEVKEKIETEVEKVANVLKKSTLNPNAKEFVLNPNAKSFTPRSPSTQTPTPPRPHTPSTNVLTQPMAAVMANQQMFTSLQPSYMLPGTVGVSLNSPFNAAATMQQAPRMRKAVPPSMHQQRHEFSQVAAATGQPLLAPASIPGHPHHLAVQYGTPHQGLIANHGQTALPYHQVYPVLGHRMVGPQHMSMVSTSHGASYGDNQHQVFGSLAAAMSGQNPHAHAASQISAMSTGPAHSTSSNQQGPPMPGQAQTAGVHPNPSPVHQPPPHGGPPPTPTPPATVGTPQPMVYQPPHPSQLGQPPPPLQPSPHTPNSPQTMHPGGQGPTGPPSHNHHMPHHNAVTHASNTSHAGPHMAQNLHAQHQVGGSGGPTGYPGPQGPQGALVLFPQGHGHPQAGHTFQGPMHGPGPTMLMPHSSMPMSVMPATSGAATMSTHPQLYITHHAASQPQLQPYPHAQ